MEVLLGLRAAIPASILVMLIVLLMFVLSRWFWRLCRLKNFDIVTFRKVCLTFCCFSLLVFSIVSFALMRASLDIPWRILESLGSGFMFSSLILLITDPNLIGKIEYKTELEN